MSAPYYNEVPMPTSWHPQSMPTPTPVSYPLPSHVDVSSDDDVSKGAIIDVQEAPASGPVSFVRKQWVREFCAELLGTFILLSFGDGVVAQTVLSDGNGGGQVTINIAWGLGVMFGIHLSGGVSGGHLNPAVTFTNALFGRMPWWKVPHYVIAQMLGAFLGAAAVYFNYYSAFHDRNDWTVATAGIFSTYPQPYMTLGSAFFNEVFATALLLAIAFSVGDKKNQPVSAFGGPFTMAAAVVAIGMAFGFNTGYAINPARDFGPRLFTSIAGWGSLVWTSSDYFFWIPIVAPLVGGPLGALVYTGLVGKLHTKE